MLNFTSIVAIAAAVLVLGFCSSRGQSPEVVRFTSKPAPNENGIVSYCYPSSSTAQLQEMNSTVLTCSWPQGDRNFQAQLVFMMRMASQPETVTVTNRAGLEEYCIAKEPIQSTVTNDRHFVDLLINKTCYENKFGSEALTITCQENGINSRAITYQGEPCINGSTVPTPAMTPVLLDSSHTTATATSLTSESISVRPTPTHDQPSPPPSDTTNAQDRRHRQEEVGREPQREMNGQNSGLQRPEDSETPSNLPKPIQVSIQTENNNAPAGFVAPQNLLPSNRDFHDISPVTSNVDLSPVDESTNTSNPAKLESSPKPQQKRDSGVRTMSNPGKEGLKHHAVAQNHGQLEESGLDLMELSAGEQLDRV